MNKLSVKNTLLGSRFLVIGVIALLLFGYICFAGPLSSAPVLDSAEPAVEQAKEDLANRKGVDKEHVTVVAVKAVNWPDTSLGCPEPGMVYAQVITPGYRILLSYGGQTYEYHSDQGDRVVYCQQ
ncbi:MAG TPA: hypothetical protein ENN57_00615 [Chloroflexi bacterium]|nr:hypothetical protein [Chloroflexota bacterium]